jgi:hypothetical protein
MTTSNTGTSTSTKTFTPTSTPTFTPTYTPTISSVVLIHPAFPNPSTGSPISFNVETPRSSTVTVDIFSLAFRKIRSFTGKVYGFQNFQWDLKDVSGNSAANGLYYVRIQVTGAQTTSKILKVLILK